MAGGSSALFDRLDSSKCERTDLEELLTLGGTTAPSLAEAAGIPKARVYSVLDSLADRGLYTVSEPTIVGRPGRDNPNCPRGK
jgi:predicted ArsR family transcriptional regulator